MYVPILNYFIDVEEAIVVLCLVILAYLAVMHIELKQLRIISNKFSKEDDEFAKCIRQLKDDLNSLSDMIRTKELKAISSHVTSGTKALNQASGTSSANSPSEPANETGDDNVQSSNGNSQLSTDPKSLKDMLDKV